MGLKIIDNNSNKRERIRKVKIAAITLISLTVISSLICYGVQKIHDHNLEIQNYKKRKEIYDDMNVNYAYSDYKKYLKNLNNVNNHNSNSSNNIVNKNDSNNKQSYEVSSISKELISRNQEKLNQIKNNSLISISEKKLKSDIEKQLESWNKFINNHVGYPDSEYSNKNGYGEMKDNIDAIVKAFKTDKWLENQWANVSIKDQAAAMRYCIWSKSKYDAVSNIKFYSILSNWLKIGHPNINIDILSILNDDNKNFDDGYKSNLQLKVVDKNGKKYKIYTQSIIKDGENPTYKILDICSLD